MNKINNLGKAIIDATLMRAQEYADPAYLRQLIDLAYLASKPRKLGKKLARNPQKYGSG